MGNYKQNLLNTAVLRQHGQHGGHMSGVVKFLLSILKLAILLAIMGDLKVATQIILHKAVEDHQHKGISFVEMNKALVGKK